MCFPSFSIFFYDFFPYVFRTFPFMLVIFPGFSHIFYVSSMKTYGMSIAKSNEIFQRRRPGRRCRTLPSPGMYRHIYCSPNIICIYIYACTISIHMYNMYIYMVHMCVYIYIMSPYQWRSGCISALNISADEHGHSEGEL